MSRDKRGVVNPVVGGSSPPATAGGEAFAALVASNGQDNRLAHEACILRLPAAGCELRFLDQV